MKAPSVGKRNAGDPLEADVAARPTGKARRRTPRPRKIVVRGALQLPPQLENWERSLLLPIALRELNSLLESDPDDAQGCAKPGADDAKE